MSGEKVSKDLKRSKKDKPNEKLIFLADHFMQMYESQRASFDAFDLKMSWFLFFQSALMIFVLQNSQLSAFFLFGSIVLSFAVIFPKKIKVAYAPQDILDKFWKESIDIENAQASIISGINDAIKKNKKTMSKKVLVSKWAITVFLIAIIFLFLKFSLLFNLVVCYI